MLQAVRKQFADYDDSTQDRIQQSTIDQAIRHLVENSTLRITVVAKHKTDKTHCLQWIDIGIWINIIEAGAQKLKILWTSSRQSISSDCHTSVGCCCGRRHVTSPGGKMSYSAVVRPDTACIFFLCVAALC